MSGGIVAIKGFEYQATVILDRLFDHFDTYGADAGVRPEGEDDLDLSWQAGPQRQRQFVQVKKPREDETGGRTPRTWSIAEAAAELMPGTLLRLTGNSDTQVWVLGDELDPDLRAVLAAGALAPAKATHSYWSLVHAMVRPEVLQGVDAPSRRSLGQWRVPEALPPDPDRACDQLIREFGVALTGRHFGGLEQRYGARLREVHAATSGVLGRVTAEAAYGSEDEVRARVLERLQREYGLSPATVEHTMFHNLKGFIQDIVKQPGRTFDLAELDLELRSVWPDMNPVRDPPTLPPDHIPRPDVIDALRAVGGLIEVTGVSGGGKSTLAAELVAHAARAGHPLGPFYVEARPEVTLRDVLAGLAFHLRRFGYREPFAAIVEGRGADDTALKKVALSFGEIGHPVGLVVDFVQGQAGATLAMQLAGLVRRRALGALNIILLAQERVLTALSAAERTAMGVGHLDLRGLTFKEFVTLAAHHGHSDRAGLHRAYEMLSGGRATGLSPQFASTLAHLKSTAEMLEIAEKPAEDRLAEADRRRFERVSVAARGAAERIVCFAVPFSRTDAEAAFSENRVGSAVAELTHLGLLTRRADLFEMHELVRAGLEETLAPAVRRDAHRALALWASTRGLVGARIHHLRRSGDEGAANDAARELFLRGEAWDVIAAYVAAKRLVTAEEAVGVFLASDAGNAWRLPDLLRTLGDASAAEILFDHVERGGLGLLGDYGRGRPVVEAILALTPARLTPLVEICLCSPGDARQREDAVQMLALAQSRSERRLDDKALAFILGRPEGERTLLAPLLWVDGRREALTMALRLGGRDPGGLGARSSPSTWLRLDSEADVAEFLAALPKVQPGLMLARRSVGMQEHARTLWELREALNRHAAALCASPAAEDLVRAQALRVLIFLGHPEVESLALSLLDVGGSVAAIAAAAPALAPGSFRREPLEARMDDVALAWPARLLIGAMLAALGVPASDLRRRLKTGAAPPPELGNWLLQRLLPVDPEDPTELATFEAALSAASGVEATTLLARLAALAETSAPSVTGLLLRMCSHPHPEIRTAAANGLTVRRDVGTAGALKTLLAKETDRLMASSLARALVACGAVQVSDLDTLSDYAEVALWRCVLAGRARDASAAPELVRIATDRHAPWRLRRSAIWAAGRLPFSVALATIAPVVLAQPLPLDFDDHEMRAHCSLGDLLEIGALAVASAPPGTRAFADDMCTFLKARWAQHLNPMAENLMARAADWLSAQLTPGQAPPADVLSTVNRLHTPLLHSAVLRALAGCGEAAPIEEQLLRNASFWHVRKAVIMRAKVGPHGPALAGELRGLISRSGFSNDPVLPRIAEEAAAGFRVPSSPPPPAEARLQPVHPITAEQARDILLGSPLVCPDDAAIQLTTPNTGSCQELIALADPVFDRDHHEITYDPDIELTPDGLGIVRSLHRHGGGSTSPSPRARLRSAIAAANSWGLPVPWHDVAVRTAYPEAYLDGFLASLGAQGNSDRFYDELVRLEPLLLPYICLRADHGLIQRFFDQRLVPFLFRQSAAGGSAMFAGLCRLAGYVTGPEIDPVLDHLLIRWLDYFPPDGRPRLEDRDHEPWRGFNALATHPRFDRIPEWRARLERALAGPLAWFEAETVALVLARHRGSYATLERRFIDAPDWQDFVVDRIDQLDGLVDQLWPPVSIVA